MEQLRTEIWDLVYQAGPQTKLQISEKLRLNQETVNVIVDHEWFTLREDLVEIATKAMA